CGFALISAVGLIGLDPFDEEIVVGILAINAFDRLLEPAAEFAGIAIGEREVDRRIRDDPVDLSPQAPQAMFLLGKDQKRIGARLPRLFVSEVLGEFTDELAGKASAFHDVEQTRGRRRFAGAWAGGEIDDLLLHAMVLLR